MTYSSDFVYNRFWPLGPTRAGRDVELVGNPRELADATTPFAVGWDHDATEPSEHLALTLELARSHFGEHDANAVAGLYRRVLAAVVDDLDRRIDDVPLLDAAEEERVRRWNASAHSIADVALHELVARVARDDPARVAVAAPGRSLTYGELESAANRLARALGRRGVGLETRVAIALERSCNLPVALLAALKAGAACVPIDSSYPAERRALMAGDAGATLLLDDVALAGLLEEAADEDAAAPAVAVPPDAACYVMFTSGSTGRPKGVVVPHRAIVNRTLAVQEQYRLTAEDRVLHKAPASFDVAISEIFWPLAAGARLVLAPPGAERDPEGIVDAIEREQVTVCEFVPSLVQALVDSYPESCRSLRFVYSGGEALPASLAAAWRARFPARLDNSYGPTETAIDVTSWPADVPGEGATVPIGVPHPNMQLHVLSDRLGPLPATIAGELCIAGAQLARGYEGRPGLTAASFVPNPFGPPGSRMYRTGDLVRRLADGAVEWLGRIDDQLKVRGFRIEPGEVEAALRSVPGIGDAAVVARDGRLVAFVAPDGVNTGGARAALAARLPDHLVPSLVVALPELPRTRNGKIDRRALPVALAERSTEVEYVAPCDLTEETLAAVFASVLGVERVGVHDNFFDLGGDSILSLTCAMRARAAGVALSPSLVFEHQTVSAIARHVSAHAPAPEPDPTPGSDGPDLSLAGLDEATAASLLERVRDTWR
jgi:amino acid adenylation domain-containing protein